MHACSDLRRKILINLMNVNLIRKLIEAAEAFSFSTHT